MRVGGRRDSRRVDRGDIERCNSILGVLLEPVPGCLLSELSTRDVSTAAIIEDDGTHSLGGTVGVEGIAGLALRLDLGETERVPVCLREGVDGRVGVHDSCVAASVPSLLTARQRLDHTSEGGGDDNTADLGLLGGGLDEVERSLNGGVDQVGVRVVHAEVEGAGCVKNSVNSEYCSIERSFRLDVLGTSHIKVRTAHTPSHICWLTSTST